MFLSSDLYCHDTQCFVTSEISVSHDDI